MRIILQDFIANRSQKRAYKHHQNLVTSILPVAFHAEHYALYASYQKARHADEIESKKDASSNKSQPKKIDKSEQDEMEQYNNFLCQSNVESVMVEFRENGQLKMVSVIDLVRDGISAVYTFYETSDTKASFGTYNVMWQIDWAKSLNFPYLYLGYWIKDSQKMAYKKNFKPLEKLIEGEWFK